MADDNFPDGKYPQHAKYRYCISSETKTLIANWNQGCTKATLVSALNSEDAGTQNILNGFAQLPPDIMAAAFGNPAGAFNLPPIPDVGTGSILGSAACLAACRGKM